MDLQIVQFKVLTQCKKWQKFQTCILFEHQVMVVQGRMCVEDPFSQIRSHIYIAIHVETHSHELLVNILYHNVAMSDQDSKEDQQMNKTMP